MITFAETATDDEIRDAVVKWSELLSQERYAEALDMFLQTSASFGFEWTPARLWDWISNCGCARKDYDSGKYLRVTSVFAQPHPEEFIRKAISVDRKNLYGLEPGQYVGMVHYGDVPLDEVPSDLTASFNIKRLEPGRITLEFVDIHVM